MNRSSQFTETDSLVVVVKAGEDQFGENRSLGISSINFKVSSLENQGFFLLENIFHARGGPAKHLHFEQDEWFFVLEGEFSFEVGDSKYSLKPGDSLLAPRKVPHVWAFTGSPLGRILVGFSPAGKMEAFFREVTKENAMPPLDAELWRTHGMELLGPPLFVG